MTKLQNTRLRVLYACDTSVHTV